MKNNLRNRIQTKVKRLKQLKIRENLKDIYKRDSLIVEYNLMLQLITENDEIDIDKFHFILNEKKTTAEELISKWNL